MSDELDSAYLRGQAGRCRRIADGITDSFMVAALRRIAEDYERNAAALQDPLFDGVPHPSMKSPSDG